VTTAAGLEAAWARLRGGRRVHGIAAALLPYSTEGRMDIDAFERHVAQACLRAGWFDAVGLGRMALSYPELPADVLAGRPLARRRLCRTFSDCTTAPRNGLVSGCYPLDDFYRARPERAALDAAKRGAAG